MTDQENTTNNTPTSNNNSLIVIAVLILLALLGGAYYYFNQSDSNEPANSTASNNTGPVATVDGVELSREEFNNNYEQLLSAYAAQGADTSNQAAIDAVREETLNTMINRQLILAAAQEEQLEVSNEEVESNFQEVVTNLGGEEGLATALASAGLDEATLRANLETDLLLQQYVNVHTNPDNITVTDEEIAAFYASVQEANPEVDSLENVSNAIREQLALQKQQEMIAKLLEDLRADAEIKVSL